MAHDESTLVEEFRDAFLATDPGGYWRKTHGDPYSAGRPDVLAALPDRAAAIEFKWSRDAANETKPLAVVAREIVTPLQARELDAIAALHGPLVPRLVIGLAVEVPGESLVLAIGADWDYLTRGLPDVWSLLKLATLLAQIREKPSRGAAIWPLFPTQIQAQLRGRGEKWRAAPIALGVTSWKWSYNPVPRE